MALADINEIRSAWQNNERDRLFELLDLKIAADRNANTDLLLQVFNENDVDAVQAADLASDFSERIKGNPVNPERLNTWLQYLIPRLLQLNTASTFDRPDLTAYAAENSLDDALLPVEIRTFSTLLEVWLAPHIKWVIDRPDRLENLSAPDRLVLVPPPGNGTHSPILHPLVLRALRTTLKDPGVDTGNLELSLWLCQELWTKVKSEPSSVSTVETSFAAGALVLDLARHKGVNFAEAIGGPVEWRDLSNKVIEYVATQSKGDAEARQAWQGKQDRVQELLNGCTFWQDTEIMNRLRGIPFTALDTCLEELEKGWTKLEETLQPEWFSPGFESAARIPLPARRSSAPFHEGTHWNDHEEYTRLLDGLQKREATVLDSSKKIVEALKLSGLTANRESFDVEFRSPLAKAALLTLAANPTVARSRIASEYIQERLAENGLQSSAFAKDIVTTVSSDHLLSQSDAWNQAVNAPATSDTDKILAAWGVLELWDKYRGRFEGTSDEADLLRKAGSLAWLQDAEPKPPDGVTHEVIRRDLAAVAHMVFLPESVSPEWVSLPGILANLAENPGIDGKLHPTFAAAAIELAITRLSGGVPWATAIPDLLSSDQLSINGVNTLLRWATVALGSGNAWENRAGMNALILIARLTDATDNILFAEKLAIAISASPKARLLIQDSLKQLLAGEFTGGRSALPLAFVAADLLRYNRTLGRGILAAGLAIHPTWLPIDGLDAGELVSRLEEAFKDEPRAKIRAASAGGGLPLRLLLLAVLEIRLDQYIRGRQLTVKAPVPNEVKPLHELRRAMRAIFSGDALLQNVLKSGWKPDGVPWWQVQYWAGFAGGEPLALAPDGYKVKDGRTPQLSMVNWLQSHRSDPLGDALMTAAALEAAVPLMPPALPSKDDMSPLVYQTRFLLDVDGRLEGEFPRFSWKASCNSLVKAVDALKTAEDDYKDALKDKVETERMVQWLKAPLRMSTADFQQQIDAALADLRRAEATLEATEHESAAAILEEAAAGFIYEAAKLEKSRQEKQVSIAALDEDIIKIDADIADIDINIAGFEEKIAGKNVEKAKKLLEKEFVARGYILEEIAAIKKVLGDPGNEPPDPNNEVLTVKVEIKKLDAQGQPTGQVETFHANGQLAAMAIRIEKTFGPKLTKALEDARVELAVALDEKRKQEKKAKRNALITKVCKTIGTIVGGFFGGPQGAALGAEIGAAVAELGIGIADNKPPEDILMGLVDNAFAISNAAGVDLEAELNELGTKGLAEVNALLDSAEESLGPLLDSLPNVFNEPMLKEAFTAFGLDEVSGMAEIAGGIFTGLKDDVKRLEEFNEESGGLGSLIKGGVKFDTAKEFKNNLQAKVRDAGLFEKTTENMEKLEVLSHRLGRDIDTLVKEPEVAAQRLTTLVLTDLSRQTIEFRSQTVINWLTDKREELRKNGKEKYWNTDVEKEADKMLANLFPHPGARDEAKRSLKSALLDPTTARGQIQDYLRGVGVKFANEGGWMGELDGHIATVMKMTEISGERHVVADQQFKDLEASITNFNGPMMRFLKGEESNERKALFNQLDILEKSLTMSELTIETLEIDQGIHQTALEISKLQVAAAEKRVAQMEWGEEKASLLSRVAELAHLREVEIVKAQEKSTAAAARRTMSAAAKVTAARFDFEKSKANLKGTLRRGAEAKRIRDDLDRPLLLDVSGSDMWEAKREHARQLRSALRAYRELLRFYVSVGAPVVELAGRPDQLGPGGIGKWSTLLEEWVSGKGEDMNSEEAFRELGIQNSDAVTEYQLTPRQIAALTSRNGLRLWFVSEEDELSDDDDSELFRFPFSPDFPLGELTENWRKLFQNHGITLSARAKFEDDKVIVDFDFDKVVIDNLWNYEITDNGLTAIAQDDSGWKLPEVRRFLVEPIANDINVVYQYTQKYARFDDTIIEGLDPTKELRTGRIVGIFLTIPKRVGGGFMSRFDYKVHAEYQGNAVYSEQGMRLRLARRGWESLAAREHVDNFMSGRTFLIEDGQKPTDVIKDAEALSKIEGDPSQLTLQGFPLAGTTILRLDPAGQSLEFESAKIQILFKSYELGPV